MALIKNLLAIHTRLLILIPQLDEKQKSRVACALGFPLVRNAPKWASVVLSLRIVSCQPMIKINMNI